MYGKAFNHSIETEIDSVVQSCNGDLRSAVNLLEIVCMGDYACVRHFESVKRAKGQTRDNGECLTFFSYEHLSTVLDPYVVARVLSLPLYPKCHTN